MPFISFEGIDGSGKSTQIDLLHDRLAEQGRNPVVLREPGGTVLSERVRQILLETSLHIVPFAELLLFSAARCQLASEKIRPLLAEGRIVICDRFYDSTVAYQGGGRGLGDFDWIREFSLRVTEGLVPDRTYYLRLPGDVAERRRRADRDDDRLERGGRSFFQRVEAAYERIASDEPERIVVIDAAQSVSEIAGTIWRDVSALLEEHV